MSNNQISVDQTTNTATLGTAIPATMNAGWTVQTDVSYGLGKRHSLDLYRPAASPQTRPLIVIVHGGAWRGGDKANEEGLAARLVELSGCAVAVPNYRLTPPKPTEGNALQHPSHAEDILCALEYLLSQAAQGETYDPARIYAMGHSCGAHILTSIFLDSASVTPSLSPSPALLKSVQGIVLTEGIYDLDILLSSFPEYLDWFVANAFGKRENYAPFSATHYPTHKEGEHIRWAIVHSKGDTLVDFKQSEAIVQHLRGIYGPKEKDANIEQYFDLFSEEHDDVFSHPNLAKLVTEFMVVK